MKLMRGIIKDPKTGNFTYVKNVPVDARSAFDGKAQIWRSLHTRNEKQANFQCAKVAEEIEKRIAEHRAGWAEQRELLSRVNHDLRQQMREQPDAIDGLNEDGTPSFIDPTAAAVHYAVQLREREKQSATGLTAAPSAQAIVPAHGMTISALIDSFIATQEGQRPPKDIGEMKTYVRRLIEVVGDKNLRALTPTDFLYFEEWLPHFPARLKARQERMGFREIIAEVGKADAPRRAPKTCKKWFDFWRLLFNWAIVRRLMDTNPVIGLAPKISRVKTRLEYDEQDVRDIFTRPMFTGCSKVYDASGKVYGYRNEPGDLIVKDTNYWLPLLACFMGFRLEEAGGMPLAEVKPKDGIHHFDMTGRKLKTDGSPRIVPLHPKIIELGFLDYVAELRRKKEKFLFPDLPHDGKTATRRFTKWWGNWCRENAIVEGEGFDHPKKVYHSFRHSFKTACHGMPEDVHDYLTGHANPSVGRDYGSHRLPMLAEQIARVSYENFPELR